MSEAGEGSKVSNAQRSLWMALFYMLIAPFFGAIAAIILLAVSLLIGSPPEPFAGETLGSSLQHLGSTSVIAFIWSVIPAAFTMLSLLPFSLKDGTFSGFLAGAIGVIAFTAAIIIVPFPTGGWQPVVAFTAGMISVLCRWILLRGGILRPTPPPAAT